MNIENHDENHTRRTALVSGGRKCLATCSVGRFFKCSGRFNNLCILCLVVWYFLVLEVMLMMSHSLVFLILVMFWNFDFLFVKKTTADVPSKIRRKSTNKKCLLHPRGCIRAKFAF